MSATWGARPPAPLQSRSRVRPVGGTTKDIEDPVSDAAESLAILRAPSGKPQAHVRRIKAAGTPCPVFRAGIGPGTCQGWHSGHDPNTTGLKPDFIAVAVESASACRDRLGCGRSRCHARRLSDAREAGGYRTESVRSAGFKAGADRVRRRYPHQMDPVAESRTTGSRRTGSLLARLEKAWQRVGGSLRIVEGSLCDRACCRFEKKSQVCDRRQRLSRE